MKAKVRALTRRPAFWALLALLSVASATFAVRYFDEAFPVLALDLEMSRAEALATARALTEAEGWGPEEYRTAATFGQPDAQVQTYVELEGGGSEAFARLGREGIYHPYQWRIRHFAEGVPTEVEVRFTPAGEPYGFDLALPEDEPGASLAAAEARARAEAAARGRWGVELDAYERLEASQTERPGGRTDHTFVYERSDVELGDARVRVRLAVAGDRLSEVTHFVHVPEGFLRRYEETRATNDTIAVLSEVVFLLLFLGVGCGVGTFFLLRDGWILWRRPLAWGGVVAVLLAGSWLNELPLAWMGYDTAISTGTFLLQHVGVAVGILVLGTPFLGFVFLAAESLTRRAFPDQLQQWRLWSRGVANSDPVLGRTAGAYLWAAVDLGFVVAFYLLVSGLEGWWTPTEALVDPDLLATPFPWLGAVALSLFAAFWEESLFRAVPLAGAVLLGRRFGGTRWWVGTALVLQALVFAAAHANYAQQPPYARVVELVLPALAWGVFYLLFGLLPVILIHFLHNVTLFSLPLFASDAPGLWPDRLVLLALVAAPLAVVLVARWRWGARREAPEDAYNGAWTPREEPEEEGERQEEGQGEHGPSPGAAPDASPLPGQLRAALVAAGVAGLVAWVAATDVRPSVPDLEVRRSEAVEVARRAVRDEGGELGDAWRPLTSVDPGADQASRFVWQEGGEDAFVRLLGTYLDPPHWHVRFARFTGEVEERAEEWEVEVGPESGVRRVMHRLPEAAPGATLEEPEARELARRALGDRLDPAPARIREVSADATRWPARRDWTFAFVVDTVGVPGQGDARVEVKIAGDRVADVRRFVHVPEEWEREEEARRTRRLMVSAGSGGILALLFLSAAVWGVVLWSRRGFDLRAFLGALAVVGGSGALSTANGWPGVMAQLQTAQPIRTQLFIMVVGIGLAVLFLAGVLALGVGMAHTWRRPGAPIRKGVGWMGAALGVAVAGLAAVADRLSPSLAPPRPSFAGAEAYVPALGAALDPIMDLVVATTVLLVVLVAADRLTDGWRRARAAGGVGLVVMGLAMTGSLFQASLVLWLAGGLAAAVLLAVLFWLVRRTHLALVPPLAAAGVILDQVERVLAAPYPGSVVGALTAIVLVAALALIWSRRLLRPPPEPRPGTGG